MKKIDLNECSNIIGGNRCSRLTDRVNRLINRKGASAIRIKKQKEKAQEACFPT